MNFLGPEFKNLRILLLILLTSVDFLFFEHELPGIDREFLGIRDDAFASGLDQYFDPEFKNLRIFFQ